MTETDRPSDSGVPLRVVVALGLVASVLARFVSPALMGSAVGIEKVILWTGRLTSLVTLLAATGLIAGVARLSTLIVASPRAPLTARLLAVPAVSMGCMLLLLSSFRPLEPMFTLLLGFSAAIVGALSARHMLSQHSKRAGALVLGLTSTAGLVHLLGRKLAQDASDTPNLSAFHVAQWIETLGVAVDLVALSLTLVWLQRRAPRGRILVPLLLASAGAIVVLAMRGATAGAGTLSVLLGRGVDSWGRNQAAVALLPPAFSHLLNVGALLAAGVALFGGGGEVGLVLAAALAARGALDMPMPALMLEVGALFLPFARSASAPRTVQKADQSANVPDSSLP